MLLCPRSASGKRGRGSIENPLPAWLYTLFYPTMQYKSILPHPLYCPGLVSVVQYSPKRNDHSLIIVEAPPAQNFNEQERHVATE